MSTSRRELAHLRIKPKRYYRILIFCTPRAGKADAVTCSAQEKYVLSISGIAEAIGGGLQGKPDRSSHQIPANMEPVRPGQCTIDVGSLILDEGQHVTKCEVLVLLRRFPLRSSSRRGFVIVIGPHLIRLSDDSG